jgi:hypothetical protein
MASRKSSLLTLLPTQKIAMAAIQTTAVRKLINTGPNAATDPWRK